MRLKQTYVQNCAKRIRFRTRVTLIATFKKESVVDWVHLSMFQKRLNWALRIHAF
jgi:hypothetical protein